ncbi:MAG: hypothetical protein ACMG6E_07775 [Candidatus Roizmanbacteria bacterium]
MIMYKLREIGTITDNSRLTREWKENINPKNPIIKTTDIKMMTDMKEDLKEEGSLLVEEAEQEEEWAKRASKENASMMIMMFMQPQGEDPEVEMTMMLLDPEVGEDLAGLTEAIGVEDSEDPLDIEEVAETSVNKMVKNHCPISITYSL